MKYFKRLGGAGVLLHLVGCASITTGHSQTVSVETRSQGKPIIGAQCKLSNDQGIWYVSTPGSATVTRSAAKLNVLCDKHGYLSGSFATRAGLQPMTFGNILLGGPIGVGVDVFSGAAFDYPGVVTYELVPDPTAMLLPPPAPVAPVIAPKPVAAARTITNAAGQCFTYSPTTGKVTGMTQC